MKESNGNGTRHNRVVLVRPSKQHQHTLIWIHGLGQTPEKYLYIFNDSLFENVKVIAPEAPVRFVTVQKKQMSSWFDIKFRNQNSFKVPFDQAFSSDEVKDSYERFLKPIIYGARQQLDLINPNGKIIISGFSQGCGMSFHCFFSQKQKINAAIGIAGALFPFTPFQLTDRLHCVLYGKEDKLRPWQYIKTVYQQKINEDKITLLDKTGHQVNAQVQKHLYIKIREILKK